MEKLLNFFKITVDDVKTEILAGLTTFFTMSYVIILIPALLSQAGMPSDAVFTASLLIIGISNIFIGLFANLPFALAPYMSDNIFIAYTLVPVLGYDWREISAVIFVIGLILFVMTITKFRLKFMDSLPLTIKTAFTSGLGICLIFSGLKDSGMIDFKDNILSLTLGNFSDYHVWLAILGAGLIILFDKFKIKLSIILGLMILTVAGIILKDTQLPQNILSLPPSISPILFKFDFSHFFTQKMITLFFLLFLLVNTELHGSMVSVMMHYREKDFQKLQKSMNKAMYVDSSATTFAGTMGIPSTGVYVDSITGIKAGGKSGLTVVIVGIMFLLSIFISPAFGVIPQYAYSAVLLYIGILLIGTIREVKYYDYSEYLSFWAVVGVMTYTLNIGLGMAFAFLIYPIFKLIARRVNEVPKEFWLFTVLSAVFFIIR